ncbi:MAG TPA: bifunctional 3-hydroxydecanoyl-ACP dehydratase/trans-2-decenoyl-ACP isomerase [Candidatus Marinimicrobia bacterium]|jgi:3-hydroxyacyl-[acyl-carrier protein] dehydratase/trans-2-decenoyl-[acyl-carrier protein] isomerase|nr:bifunctional 3-hydroxydecanoyl-ACP dehydratase/trans-2-decenoyl-ACP isomerase [Candidatus Neomarinimicrobiota bacterium]|tara:strand:- start:173 stop:718 length:546 start_codon:yes stop_codon:yes gene_type:complete
MERKNSFTKEDLINSGLGKLFLGVKGKLPRPPMLMMDRILHISDEGGKYGKGEIKAELDINKSLWFFDCHFKNDPVMPGCLGLDGFWQLIGFFLSWAGGQGRGRALGVKDLKFKGQVRPFHEKIIYQIDIRKFITKPTYIAWGDAVLEVKDKTIYYAKDLQVGLFDNLTWDYGKDPALDPF